MEDLEVAPPLHSTHGNDPAYIRFVNKTSRQVEIIWINFTGGYIKYGVLPANGYVDINTFKGHPWMAIDALTKDRLQIENEFIYQPKTTKEYFHIRYPTRNFPNGWEARVVAAITIPVYTLKFRTLLQIRDRLRLPKDVDQLELPKPLMDNLKRVIILRNNRLMQPLIGVS